MGLYDSRDHLGFQQCNRAIALVEMAVGVVERAHTIVLHTYSSYVNIVTHN